MGPSMEVATRPVKMPVEEAVAPIAVPSMLPPLMSAVVRMALENVLTPVAVWADPRSMTLLESLASARVPLPTWEAAMSMLVLDAAVIRPCASTVNVPTCVPDP